MPPRLVVSTQRQALVQAWFGECGRRDDSWRVRRRRAQRHRVRVAHERVCTRSYDRTGRGDGRACGREPERSPGGVPLRPRGPNRRRRERARCVSIGASGRDHEPGLQHRWTKDRHRWARPPGSHLERFQRQAHPRARWSPRPRARRRDRRRRGRGRNGEHRRDSPDLGRAHRASASTPLRAHELRSDGRLQPGRPVGRHCERRRDRADVGH